MAAKTTEARLKRLEGELMKTKQERDMYKRQTEQQLEQQPATTHTTDTIAQQVIATNATISTPIQQPQSIKDIMNSIKTCGNINIVKIINGCIRRRARPPDSDDPPGDRSNGGGFYNLGNGGGSDHGGGGDDLEVVALQQRVGAEAGVRIEAGSLHWSSLVIPSYKF